MFLFCLSIVRVDVHSSDVRIESQENDYEDIYLVREEAAAVVSSPSGTAKKSIVNITSPYSSRPASQQGSRPASQQGSRPPSRLENASRPTSQQSSRPPSLHGSSRPPSVTSFTIDGPPEPPRRNGAPPQFEREFLIFFWASFCVGMHDLTI